MPGDNCAVFGCGSCRRTKGIGIWKLPFPRNDEYKKWRLEWLNEIKKTREVDSDFQKQIDGDRVYTCEKHFAPEDIEIFQTAKMTKKKPMFGALPVRNMPKRSHETDKTTRRPPKVVVTVEETTSCSRYYKNFRDLCKRVKSLKTLSEWTQQELEDRIVLKKILPSLQIPELEIVIDDSLGFTILVYGWLLPEDHELYTKNFRSINNITASDLVKHVERCLICPGVETNVFTGNVLPHIIPRVVDPLSIDREDNNLDSFPSKQYWRSRGCSVLCHADEQYCSSCSQYLHASDLSKKAKQRKLAEPAHIKAPVSKTAPERIKLTLQNQRLRCADLERQLDEMRTELTKSSVEVDPELSDDFATILGPLN